MKKRKMSSVSGKSSDADNIESVDVYYSNDEDDVGFSEGEPKIGNNTIATFNFSANSMQNGSIKSINEEVVPKMPLFEMKTVSETSKVSLRGLTPPIDGEYFTIKRGYQFRPSTLRKLNELKAFHPDLNVYINTLLDAAILHYYNYIMNKGGKS